MAPSLSKSVALKTFFFFFCWLLYGLWGGLPKPKGLLDTRANPDLVLLNLVWHVIS